MGYSMPFSSSGLDGATINTIYLPFGKAAKRIVLTNTGATTVYFWPAWYPTLSSFTTDHALDSSVQFAAGSDGVWTTTDISDITNMSRAYLYGETSGKYYKIQSISHASTVRMVGPDLIETHSVTVRLVGRPALDLTETHSVVLMKPTACSVNTWLDNVPLPWAENAWKFSASAAWSVEGSLICEN